MDCSLPGLRSLSVHGIFQARVLEWVAIPFSRDLPNPGIEARSPTLQADTYRLSHQGSLWSVNYTLTRIVIGIVSLEIGKKHPAMTWRKEQLRFFMVGE